MDRYSVEYGGETVIMDSLAKRNLEYLIWVAMFLVIALRQS